jgi:hypothetical protein
VNIAESVKKLVKENKLSPRIKDDKENSMNKHIQKGNNKSGSLFNKKVNEKVVENIWVTPGGSSKLLELQKELIIEDVANKKPTRKNNDLLKGDLSQDKQTKYKEHDLFFRNKNDTKNTENTKNMGNKNDVKNGGNNMNSIKDKFIKLKQPKEIRRETDSMSSYLNVEELLKYNYKGGTPMGFQKNLNKTFF